MSNTLYRWVILAGVLAVSGCTSVDPTPEQYRSLVKNKASFLFKTETFILPKPFPAVMAVAKPQFERCFNYIKPGMLTREVLPSRREGRVVLKGRGKAEFIFRESGRIISIADVEAAGNSTKVTIGGVYVAPVARGFRSWTQGDTSCPIGLELPFAVF